MTNHTCGQSFFLWKQALDEEEHKEQVETLSVRDRILKEKDNFKQTYCKVHSAYLGTVTIPLSQQQHLNDNGNLNFFFEAKVHGQIIRIVDFNSKYMSPMKIPTNFVLNKLPTKSINLHDNEYHAYINDLSYNCLCSLRHETPRCLSKYNQILYKRAKASYPCLFTHILNDAYQAYKEIYCWSLQQLCAVDIFFATVEFLQYLHNIFVQVPNIVDAPVFTSIVNVKDLENAYYNGYCCVYGTGKTVFKTLTSLDVIAHELFHGITQHTCRLLYQGESGALNESYSDIVACCFEAHVYAKYPHLRGRKDWYIGEDVMQDGQKHELRNFIDPEQCYQPKKYKGRYFVSPTHTYDHGGVHVNSGIINHLFFQFVQHSKHNIQVCLRIFIAVYEHLTPQSTFKDLVRKLKVETKGHAMFETAMLQSLEICNLNF